MFCLYLYPMDRKLLRKSNLNEKSETDIYDSLYNNYMCLKWNFFFRFSSWMGLPSRCRYVLVLDPQNIKWHVPFSKSHEVLQTLFLIYINDIADNIASLTRLFADNTSLSYSSYSYQLLETKINSDLVKINDWANTWLIKFNSNKTTLLFVSNTLPSDCINLYFQNSLLDSCGTHRHLGITFSEN